MCVCTSMGQFWFCIKFIMFYNSVYLPMCCIHCLFFSSDLFCPIGSLHWTDMFFFQFGSFPSVYSIVWYDSQWSPPLRPVWLCDWSHLCLIVSTYLCPSLEIAPVVFASYDSAFPLWFFYNVLAFCFYLDSCFWSFDFFCLPFRMRCSGLCDFSVHELLFCGFNSCLQVISPSLLSLLPLSTYGSHRSYNFQHTVH